MTGVRIKVTSDSRAARRDLESLNNSVKKIEGSVNLLSKAFATAAAAFSGVSITRAINQATDSLTTLQNRVALVTGRGQELNDQLDSLYKISARTRAPITGVTDTFNRFAIALKGSGVTLDEINEAIENVGRAGAIGGTGVESLNAALFQLGQGLASGTLRGQELNSVLEQAPRLAQAIVDGAGIARDELKQFAEEGKLTTEVVFEAILSQTETLRREFALTQATSAESMARLRTNISRVTAEISKQLKITESYSNNINKLNVFLEENRKQVVTTVVDFANSFKGSFDGIKTLVSGIRDVSNAVFNNFDLLFPRTSNAFSKAVDLFNKLGERASGVSQSVGASIKTYIQGSIDDYIESIENPAARLAVRKLFDSKSIGEFGSKLSQIADGINKYGKNARVLLKIQSYLDAFTSGVKAGINQLSSYISGFSKFSNFIKGLFVEEEEAEKTITFLDRLKAGFDRIKQIVSGFSTKIENFKKFLYGEDNSKVDVTQDSLVTVYKKLFTDEFAPQIGFIDKVKNKFNELTESVRANFDLIKSSSYYQKLASFVKKLISAFRGQSAVDPASEANPTNSVGEGELPQENLSGFAKTLKSLKDITVQYTTPVINIISKFINFVSDKFAWLYDKVIGNSWWTDTMVGVYDYAVNFLTKALNVVKKFADRVSAYFFGVNQEVQNELPGTEELVDPDVQEIKKQVFIERVKVKLSELTALARDVRDSISAAISAGLQTVVTTFNQVSPVVASAISAGALAGLTAVFAPGVFKNLLEKIIPIFRLTLVAGLIGNFGQAIAKSGVLESAAAGFGTLVGTIVETIAESLPEILAALVRMAKAFGEALQDALSDSILGLPAKIFSAFNGIAGLGGILTTLFYGTAGLAVFSKGVRSEVTRLIAFIITSVAKRGYLGQGLLYNLTVGQDTKTQRENLEKTYLSGAGAGVTGKANISAARKKAAQDAKEITESAKTASRESLAILGATTLSLNLFLSQVAGIPAEWANTLSILGGGIAQALLSDTSIKDVVGRFKSLVNFIGSSVKGNFGQVGTTISNVFRNTWQKIDSTTVAQNVKTSSKVKAVWGAAGKAISSRYSIILATIAASLLATAAFADDTGDSLGDAFNPQGINFQALTLQIATIGTALVGLYDIISLSPTLKSKIDTVLDYIGSGIGKALSKGANLASKGFNLIAQAGGTVLAGVVAGAGTLLGILGVAGLAGLIYSIWWGEGDSFGERVGSNLRLLLESVGVVESRFKKISGQINKDLLKNQKQLESLVDRGALSGRDVGSKLNINAKIFGQDLSKLDNKELRKLVELTRQRGILANKAEDQQNRYNSIDEDISQQIASNTKEIATILKGSDPFSNPEEIFKDVTEPFAKALGALLEGENKGRFEKITRALEAGIRSENIDLNPSRDTNGNVLSRFLEDVVFGLRGGVGAKPREIAAERINEPLKPLEKLFVDLSQQRFDFSSSAGRTNFIDSLIADPAIADKFNEAFGDQFLLGLRRVASSELIGGETARVITDTLTSALTAYFRNDFETLGKRLSGRRSERDDLLEELRVLENNNELGTFTDAQYEDRRSELNNQLSDVRSQIATLEENLSEIQAFGIFSKEVSDELNAAKAAGEIQRLVNNREAFFKRLADDFEITLDDKQKKLFSAAAVDSISQLFNNESLRSALESEDFNINNVIDELIRGTSATELQSRYTDAGLDIETYTKALNIIQKIQQAVNEVIEIPIQIPDRANQLIEFLSGETSVDLEFGSLTQENLKKISSALDQTSVGGFDLTSVVAVESEIVGLLKEKEKREKAIAALKEKQGPLEIDEKTALEGNLLVINDIEQKLQNFANLLNTANLQGQDFRSVISEALSEFDDFDVDLDKIFSLDNATIQQILDAAVAIAIANSQIEALRAGGDFGFARLLEDSTLKAAQERLSKLLNANKSSIKEKPKGGDKQSGFEKLVERIGASGFSFEEEQVAAFGSEILSKVVGPLKQIEDAQKRITKSGENDVGVRQKALDLIKQSKDQLLTIFSSGTVEQANVAGEAFGIENLGLLNDRQKEVALNLIDLQTRLNNLQATDIAGKEKINQLIGQQEILLEGLTTEAEASAEAVKESIKSNISEFLKGTQTFKETIEGILDTITSRIIDTVVNTFVDTLFEGPIKNFFESLFAGLADTASSAGAKMGEAMSDAIGNALNSGANGEDGFFSVLLKGLGSILKTIFSFFGGGGAPISGGGGKHAGGIIQKRAAGGLVNPLIGQAGKDSVPVMLTPGEYVLPSQRAAELFKEQSSRSGQQTVVNLNVTGDISRQTKKEIIKMIPQITQGVNSTNRERNFKG